MNWCFFLQKSTNTVCVECLGTDTKGPAGGPEPLSSCNGCGMSLHNKCASGDSELVPPLSVLVTRGNKWFCEECRSCDACATQNERGPCVLSCGNCPKAFHFSCMDPGLSDLKKVKTIWRFVWNRLSFAWDVGCLTDLFLVISGALYVWIITTKPPRQRSVPQALKHKSESYLKHWRKKERRSNSFR